MTGPRLIAIASGKGGVGKTWFSITLAHALARSGRRVLLVDADLGLANVDIQLGLTPAQDLGVLLAGKVPLRDVVMRYREGGFDVLPGRSGSGALAGLSGAALGPLVVTLREAPYSDILLDLAAGLEPPVRRLAAAADMLLVLATGEPTSLTDAYAVLKLYASDRAGGNARVIVNQAPTHAAGERTYQTLRRASLAFLGQAPEMAGIIRRDERVPEAIRRQTLLLTRHPTSPVADDIGQVCRSLG